MRIALGTVQFGLRYGIANRTGQVTPEQAGEILEIARAASIDTLDTAIDYGESELRLGGAGVAGFRIVTKQRWPAWRYRGAYVPGGVPGNPLGVCWLGLGMPASWRGAPVGLHGTNTPWVIGRPVTHGCVRLRNEDALRLYRMVSIGTPVWILP